MSKIDIKTRYDIQKNMSRYNRIRALMDNDESEFESEEFCLKFPNEPPNARDVRKRLFKTSFKNITNDLLSATKDAIFHEGIRLEFKGKEADPLYAWSKNVTRGGDDIDLLTYIQDVVVYGLRGYGHVWTVIDKPNYEAVNFQDELEKGQPYIANIWPGNVVNYEIINGDLQWFAYKCKHLSPWLDPTSPPEITSPREQLRIWTKTEYIIIDNGEITVRFPHKYGFVPVVYQSFILPSDDNSILGVTPFFTSSNMIIFANNLQSVADLELIKHGNSVLLVNEEGITPNNTEIDGEGGSHTKLVDPTGYNKYIYTGEKPEYLIKNLESVPLANKQAEKYFMAAIQNERTMQSIIHKRDTVRESGETKQYDAEPARVALRATAMDCEAYVKKLLNMVAVMLGRENLKNSFICEFPERYILTKTLGEKFDEIQKMITTRYPSVTGMKELYKSLTPDIAHNDTVRNTINDEIEAADITIQSDEEIMNAVEKEMADDAEFESSLEGKNDEEKEIERAKRKNKVQG